MPDSMKIGLSFCFSNHIGTLGHLYLSFRKIWYKEIHCLFGYCNQSSPLIKQAPRSVGLKAGAMIVKEMPRLPIRERNGLKTPCFRRSSDIKSFYLEPSSLTADCMGHT